MNLRDIIEGYFVIKELRKKGYIDDNLGLANFIRTVLQAERNIKKVEEVEHEDK